MIQSKVGDIIEGTVVRVYPKYAIMLFDNQETGLLHISELSNNFVRNFSGYVQTGNIYKVKVIEVDLEKDFMKVSLKAIGTAEKKKPLTRKKVREEDISFTALKEKLPQWIEEAE